MTPASIADAAQRFQGIDCAPPNAKNYLASEAPGPGDIMSEHTGRLHLLHLTPDLEPVTRVDQESAFDLISGLCVLDDKPSWRSRQSQKFRRPGSFAAAN
jgi:hypothetical protein